MEKKLISNYLIKSNIVNVDGRIFHSNGYDVIILRMECYEGGCRRRCHECCHYLQLKETHMVNHKKGSQYFENFLDCMSIYLKCHHVK